MSFLSARKDTSILSIAVDISSGSTGGAIIRNFKTGLPEMLTDVRTPFLINGKPSASSMESAMLSSLNATLSSLLKKIPPQARGIDKIFVSFSSPWIISHLKTVILNKESRFVFDDKMLKTIVNEEKEVFFSRMGKNFEEESEVFESIVTNLYLDGYEAQKTVKEKVGKVEMSFLISVISKELLEKIENAINKSMSAKNGIFFHSFIYIFFKVLSHSFQDLHSALLINMTSEVTDTLFLRHGNSALTGSLPFGPGSIGRAVSEKLNIPEALAYSYLSLFAASALDENTTKAVDAVLMEVEEKWNELWRSMGEGIPEGTSIPYSIFLIVPTGFERLIKTFLEGVFEKKNIILLGETNAFTKELVKTSPTTQVPDENLLILSSFSNLLK